MLRAILLAAQAASLNPTISISKVGSTYRAEVAPFDMSAERAVESAIYRRAEELCADKVIRWGEFGSVSKIDTTPSSAPARITGYYKEFSCVVTELPAVAEVPVDWKATAQDEADIRHFFETYYAKRDSGDFKGAAAMVAAEMRSDRSDEIRNFNRSLGKGSRRISGITWYVNRADAPKLGAYAALDFIGQYPDVHVYCGYLVLYRLGPGKYEITREEQTIFARDDEAVDPAQVEAVRLSSCRGN